MPRAWGCVVRGGERCRAAFGAPVEFTRFGLRVGGGCDGGGGGKEPSASEGEWHRAGGPAPRPSLLLGVTPRLKVPLFVAAVRKRGEVRTRTPFA